MRVTLLSFLPVSPLALILGAADLPAQDRGIRTEGTLVIAGGGGLPDEVTGEFCRLAGGKESRIVVIPTASANADRPDNGRTAELWKGRGAGEVIVLHTRAKDEANTEAFVAPLKEATGVWFGGGSQSRITEAYLGTAVEKELWALLRRGGVVGGSSAGAAIMTKVMITGGNPVARTGPGFGFFPGSVVDQHFLRRSRVNRLLGVLVDNPGLVGFGIDERTAIIATETEIRAIGSSYVTVFVLQPSGKPVRIEVLEDGESADLAELAAEAAKRR